MKPDLPPLGPDLGDEDEAEEEATAAESPAARATPHSGAGGSSVSSHDQATLPGTGRGASSAGHSRSASATLLRVMRGEELERARGFAGMIALLSLFALIPVGLVARESTIAPLWLHLCTAAVMLTSGLSGAWVWLLVRRARRPFRMIRIFAASCVATALMVQYYSGVFSPAPTLIALGI